MKTTLKLLAILMSVAMFIGLLAVQSFAIEMPAIGDIGESQPGDCIINAPPSYFEEKCDGMEFGRSDWPSLSAAMNYYGTGFTYNSCYVNNGGTVYNYYYTFASGTRMYFGVTG